MLPLAACIGAIAVQVPVAGSYSSAESNASSVPTSKPPTTSTLPSGSRMAAWARLDVIIFPAEVHVPLSGSYSWDEEPSLPVTSTLPSRNTVAVRGLALIILPVGVHVPLSGSYTSAPKIGSQRARVVGIPNEHPAIAQQRGREAIARLEHVPGGGPGPGVGVVQLRGGRVGLVGRRRPPRAPGHRAAAPRCGRSEACPSFRWRSSCPPEGWLATRVAARRRQGCTTPPAPGHLPRGPCHRAATWPSHRRRRQV